MGCVPSSPPTTMPPTTTAAAMSRTNRATGRPIQVTSGAVGRPGMSGATRTPAVQSRTRRTGRPHQRLRETFRTVMAPESYRSLVSLYWDFPALSWCKWPQ